MVDVSVQGPVLHLEIRGWDKLWAFKSQFEIPLVHVKSVSTLSGRGELEEMARQLGFGIRALGTGVPGLIAAGTFYFVRGGRVFLDVHRPFERVLVIDLAEEPYRKLVVEVEDPEEAVRLIQGALSALASV